MTQTKYTRKVVDSDNVDIVNAVQPIGHETTGGVEIDTTPVFATDALEYEQFMRDELEVMFNEPQSENDPSFVEVNVNGDYRLAVRGQATKLRRYHVAVLAQAKQARLRQRKIVNADGSMGFVEETVLSLTYPFSVISDPNPKKGGPWLKQLLSNPA